MNEQRLAALFRDAVGELPPAFFGRDEVVAASRRSTARRRSALAGGTLFGVAVLVGGLVAGGQVLQGQTSTAAGQPAPEADAEVADPAAPHVLGAPPGAETPVPRTSAASEQAGCGPLDNTLAADVTAVLADRGTAVAGPADEVAEPCPDGSRAAALPIVDGVLSIVVIPQAGALEPMDVLQPDGRHEHARILDDGRGLMVILMPAVQGQTPPLCHELTELAGHLAARL
ncbi:MAG: hypothetical protein ACRDSL_06420 [Pseudonocardiaceae bacterium]